MIIHSHPTGNFNVRMTAKALYEAELLEEFHSCLCLPKSNFIINIFGKKVREEYERRVFLNIPQKLQFSHPYREIARIANQRLNIINNDNDKISGISIDSIYKDFDSQIAARLKNNDKARAIYAYEDGAKNSFKQAKKSGIKCIYELPIGYWKSARNIFEEEKAINPEWASTLTGLNDSNEKLERKDEELARADDIIVASKFTKETLAQCNMTNKNTHIIPYCTPAMITTNEPTIGKDSLRILYVGSLTQRKGISYAIDAVDQLGEAVTLTIIGKKNTCECKKLNNALERFSWYESLPHNRILEQMRLHDVLLFPTLFDGFGLVITEALSQGLPIITTKNSGGPECIRNGIEGYIVPIRDVNAISMCLEGLSKDRDKLKQMKLNCIKRARSLNYDRFSKNLITVIKDIIS